jgi:STE24 endopeptidase
MHAFTLLFLLALAGSVTLRLWLARRHIAHVSRHRAQVPDSFAGRVAIEEHHKAADYTVTNTRTGMLALLYDTALLLGWTLGGGLEWLDGLVRGAGYPPVITGTAVILAFLVLSTLLDLPFSLYHTFVVEQRFGFNRSTPGLFVSDLLKQALLLGVIGTPLIALALWIMQATGGLWWLYVWLVWTAFTLLMTWAWPAFIAPLFNRFSPLTDESLKQRIQALMDRCGFRSSGIFVMDGSRRSGHGNAYFTGFGNNKRIVFFDTLLESLEPVEIEAVLAHELGHFRLHHIRKRLMTGLLMSLAALALLGWLSGQDWFYHSLGIHTPSSWMALLLFMLVLPVFTFILQPLMSRLSRRHEFEADAYAVQQSSGNDLVQALVKMYRENASTLTPDPLYSAWHDSHPPAPVRIARIYATMNP